MTTDQHLTFDLAGPGDDALHRVLAVCHARRCTVTAVRFERGDRHRPPRLELGLAGDAQQVGRLVRRLETLVGVQRGSATPRGAAARSASPTPHDERATPASR